MFDCRLKGVANGPLEETMAVVAIIGNVIYVSYGSNN